MNVLIIDNFDSFTYNLVDEFKKRKCETLIYRNNVDKTILRRAVLRFKSDLIVISPGPCAPKDAGVSIDTIKTYADKIPIFGVCLGHQCIIEAFYGRVAKAAETLHGKKSNISHDGRTIYKGLSNPFQAGRYHSLGGDKIPAALEVSARSNSTVMGVRHTDFLVEGVQFHPESILTSEGGIIIDNLLRMVKGR